MHHDPLEPRRLLSANLDAGTLTVAGTAEADRVAVYARDVPTGDGSTVFAGRTSVRLDTDALADAGLDFDGRRGRATFAVTRDSDLTYAPDALAVQRGTIEHRGRLSFNDGDLRIGRFSIGFDAARVDADTGAGGFFVADNLADRGVVFDLAGGEVTAGDRVLRLAGADLLVSPELAGTLGDAALTGADVGDASTLAFARPETSREVVVRGLTDEPARFDADDVQNVSIDLAGGDDRLYVARLDLAGDLTIDTGDGADRVYVVRTTAASTVASLGTGNDRARFVAAAGSIFADGGEGDDAVFAARSDVSDDDVVNFETVRIV